MATKIKVSNDFNEVAARKLESSGLTAAQGSALGMYSVANAASLDPWFEGQPALVIPYFATNGKPLKAHPAWPEFYRARYLGEDHSFKAATTAKKSRYVQPSNTGVCAYFPQLIDWEEIRKDVGSTLLITEGELKAAKATAEGFPTIGLGGVHNFRSAKAGLFFLPELEAFTWPRRKVVICYDSDFQTNSGICQAINTLAEELQERGALVSLITLPDVYDEEDKKTGLDDFLVERSDDDLIKLINAAEHIGITRPLWKMNDDVVYVRDPGFVVAQKKGVKMDPAKFTSHSDFATASCSEGKVDKNGNISYSKVSAAPVWLKWPLRRAVDELTYMPGKERFCEAEGNTYYNQWKGWGCAPKKGSVKPWLELVDFIFSGATKEEVKWFLDWCAYPIQYPGTKLFSAVLLHGRTTGTGKTLIFYTLKKIYGENFYKITNEDLKNTWWLENKQFILGDEISGSDKRSENNALKAMITQEEATINIKYVPQFSVPDCANYGFTSNHADAFFLEDEDRRNFIIEVMAEKPLAREFYKEYEAWKEGDGPSALMHWLLERDLKGFDAKGPPPRTAARERMIVSGKSDLGLWCHELKENPADKLMVGSMRHQKDLFTSAELLTIYQNETGDTRATKNGLSRKMAEAGFRLAYNEMPISGDGIKPGRYFVVRNKEHWKSVKAVKPHIVNIKLQPVK